MNTVIIIPARMASSRFPNKPLACIYGKTMIERVWAIAKSAKLASEVMIATDSEELCEFVKGFGANVIMTRSDCISGTDRVAEAALDLDCSTVFNLQGDAVLTPPWVIDKVIEVMQDPDIEMATPMVRLEGNALHEFVENKKRGSSTGTLVTFDKWKNAMYFSKALIPFCREERILYRHIGLYAYRKDILQKLRGLKEGVFERCEKLEQLRALENGIPIRMVEVDYAGRTHGSVDRPEDVKWVESVIEREGELVV